ncbi:MAG: hypothetical protein ACLFVU_14155 [Phycisphaerae bacterium]
MTPANNITDPIAARMAHVETSSPRPKPARARAKNPKTAIFVASDFISFGYCFLLRQ